MKSLVVIILTITSFGCSTRLSMHNTAQPIPSASFPPYETFALLNHIPTYYLEDQRSPSFTLVVRIKSGKMESLHKNGTSTLLASLLDKGTTSKNAEAFNQAIDKLGLSFSCRDDDEYITMKILGLNIYYKEMIALLSDALINPAFQEDELTKVKKKISSSLQASKETPSYLLDNMERIVLYGKEHSLTQVLTEDAVNRISSNDIKQFHGTHFVATNISIVFSGDVVLSQVKDELNARLSKIQTKEISKVFQSPAPLYSEPTVFIVDRPASVQSNISVLSPYISFADSDRVECDVLTTILGGGYSGRLFQNLREKHGWTYGVSSSPSLFRSSGYLSHTTEVRNNVTDSAITQILHEIKQISTDPTSKEELSMNQNYLAGNYLLSLEHTEINANRLLNMEMYGLPKNFYSTLTKRYLQITPEQILTLAKKYLSMNNYAIVVVGNAKEISTSLEKFGKVVVYDMNFEPQTTIDSSKIFKGTTDEFIAKIVTAYGGNETIANIKTLKISGAITSQVKTNNLSANGSFQIIKKSPDKASFLINLLNSSVYETRVNENKVQELEQDKPKTISNEQRAKYLLDAKINEFANYKENKKISYLQNGSIKENGKSYYLLQRNFTDYPSLKCLFYVDEETFLIHKQVETILHEKDSMEMVSVFSDYDKQEKFTYPKTLTQTLGELTMTYKVISVEINKFVSDNIFKIK